MSQTTGQQENAKSSTPNYAEETHNKNSLAENEQLEGTPFVIRYRANKGWFLTIGDTRITEPTLTKKQTLDRMTNEMWTLIAGMIVHIVKLLKEDDIVTHHITQE